MTNMDKSLKNVMTTRLVTVELDDTLAVVKQIFDSVKFRHLLVVDSHKKLCGVISDRDLLRALSPHIGTLAENARDTATLHKRVHQIMTRHPVTLDAGGHLGRRHQAVPRAPRLVCPGRRAGLQGRGHRQLAGCAEIALALK